MHVDSQDLLVSPALKATEDSMDKPEKMVNPVKMVIPDHKVLKVTKVPQVLLVHQVNKDHEDIQVNLVKPVLEAQLVCTENLVHPVQWVQPVPLVSRVTPDLKVNLVLLEIKVPKVHRVPVVKMVFLDLLAPLVFQVLLV